MEFKPDVTQSSFAHILSKDERILLLWWFKCISEDVEHIPSKTYSAMADIEVKMLKTNKLTDNQIQFVSNVYDQYCHGD
jgi:hypothetical protein